MVGRRCMLSDVLPVAFVGGLIALICSVFIAFHIIPLFRRDPVWGSLLGAELDEGARMRAIFQGTTFTLLMVLLLFSFVKAITTHPGMVPNEANWKQHGVISKASDGEPDTSLCKEVKNTGERRFCKWCDKYKPDRCHHCRICQACVLKMDHHCPWIANCVGFRNHKYFFLLVLYSLTSCIFVIATMNESLQRAVYQEDTSCGHRFLLVLGMTFASLLCMLLFVFLAFHTWLMFQATTTIEFCEKAYRKFGQSNTGTAQSMYNIRPFANVKAVLGENILLWFLPVSLPIGDGLHFTSASAKLIVARASEREPSAKAEKAFLVDKLSNDEADHKSSPAAALAPEVTANVNSTN